MVKKGVAGVGRFARGGVRGSVALALLPLSMGCVEIVDGNKVLTEESRDATGFDRVNARGGLDISISRGDFSVSVRIDENLQPYVLTRVDGDTLEIEVDDANIRKKLPGPHVIIAMPTLSDAETSGEGSLTAAEFTTEEPVSLELQGAGKLSWTGRATDLDVVLAGSGDLFIEGSAETTEFSLRGSGTIDARDLIAEAADIQLDGEGALSVTVNGPVNARAANGGSIDLFGRVVEGDLERSTGATITTH